MQINSNNQIISLTTDFGLTDNYVGVVKAVMTGLNNRVKIIDSTHDIPKFNISSGCYMLETAYKYFPRGTIHLAVVDPGVGTKREAVLIETNDYYFIGPDNGLFSFLGKKEIRKIVALKNKKYFLKNISATFHARDIFAPVAGYLSLGISPDEFGPQIKTINKLKSIKIRKTKAGLISNIVHIDSFGNIVTSFRLSDLPDNKITIYLGQDKIGRLKKTYGSVQEGRPVTYINSFGYLEIAVSNGSAADYFSVDDQSNKKILIATSSKLM